MKWLWKRAKQNRPENDFQVFKDRKKNDENNAKEIYEQLIGRIFKITTEESPGKFWQSTNNH